MTCIYCGNLLGEGSDEHIILSSLGGRKQSKNICCHDCNTRLGGTIDKDFADRIQFLSNQIGLTTGRNKPAPTLRRVGTGIFNLPPDGPPELAKATVEEQTNPETGDKTIQISARSLDEAKRLVDGQLKRFGLDAKNVMIVAKEKSTYIPEFQIRLEIHPQDFRSIAKMILNYLAVKVAPERIRDGNFAEIIGFIDKGVELPVNWITPDYVNDFPETANASPFNHRVFVFASNTDKAAFGLLELFGHLRFSCLLSERWNGPEVSSVYIVDPIEAQGWEEVIPQPENINKTSVLESEYDFEKGTLAVQALFADLGKHGQMRLSNSLVENALSGLQEGEIFTEEVISNLANEMSANLVRHLYRIDTERPIDISRLFEQIEDDDSK